MAGVFDVLVMAMTTIWTYGLETVNFLLFSLVVLTTLTLAILSPVVYSAISKITTIPTPPPEPPLLRRERRAAAATVRRSSLFSTAPVTISAFDIEVITRYTPQPRDLLHSFPIVSTSTTKMYPSAIGDIVAKMARCGLEPKFRYDGLLVDWVPVAPQGARSALLEFPASQEGKTRDEHGEPDIHALLVTAEMSAPLAGSRPSTPVVAAPADLATDASPQAGPVEPPQCHSAASAADAGRAHVPTSTERLVSQVVEPPQGDSAASAANPGGAHMPASTDRMARPTGIAPVANVPTWTPSSGPQMLPPRPPHPLFTFPTWTPSTGVEYHLREPHPLFTAPWRTPAPTAPAPAPRPVPSVVVSLPTPRPLPSPIVSSPAPAPRPIPPPVVWSPRPLPLGAVFAPAPRPAPVALATAAPAAATSTPAPAPPRVPRPPRHARSLPAAALRAPAPAPVLTPAPAPTPPPAAASSSPSPDDTPSVAARLDAQNFMAPLSQLLALDIERLGLTEAELMAWVVPQGTIKPGRMTNSADELKAQQDPLTVAKRYGLIARDVKRAAVLLRLQLLRVSQGRFPARTQFSRLISPVHEAASTFDILRKAGYGHGDADFAVFTNALRFISHHVMSMGEFEAWMVHCEGEEVGKARSNLFKNRVNRAGAFLGIRQPILAQLGLA